MSKIGLIGLGDMGIGMARNIVANEFELHGFDLRPERLQALESLGGNPAASIAEAAEGVRFSGKWVKSHRNKLGLSAAHYSHLVGVSTMTIYNWERGHSRPRAKQLAAWAAIRGIGKREAWRRLEPVRLV